MAPADLSPSVSVSLDLVGPTAQYYGASGKVVADTDYAMYIQDTTDHAITLHVAASGAGSITQTGTEDHGTHLESQMLILGSDNSALGFGQNQTINNRNPVVTSFNWSVDGDYVFHTNTRYDIDLTAWVQAQTLDGNTAHLAAFVDPVFTIDDPHAGTAQLVFSQGIQNVEPVPEPGEWAMIAAGLGLVGAVVRRRKRK